VSAFWILVPLGYALGMFQSAEMVGRFVGRDPRREGSRNPGASNMYRLAGRNAAGIVLAIDVIKGFIPALAGLGKCDRPRVASHSPIPRR